MVELEDCESLFTYLKAKKMITEKYLVRHFLNTQQAFEGRDLDNANWLTGAENSVDGLTNVRSDMVPLLRLLGSGRLNPGSLRPLKRAACRDGGGRL